MCRARYCEGYLHDYPNSHATRWHARASRLQPARDSPSPLLPAWLSAERVLLTLREASAICGLDRETSHPTTTTVPGVSSPRWMFISGFIMYPSAGDSSLLRNRESLATERRAAATKLEFGIPCPPRFARHRSRASGSSVPLSVRNFESGPG